MTESELRLSQGLDLPVMEHFYTLQGEGAYAGHAAYFIRLGGCDVGCHWCDVKESWDPNIHPVMDAFTVAEIAAQYGKTVILTGGEPLMWNLKPLTQRLKQLGCRIHIETSGAYPMSGELDWITLSPKKNALPLEDIYPRTQELKVIVYNRHDLIFAQQQATKVGKDCRLYLQAEWSKREKIYPLITAFAMENPRWAISVQTHKYLHIP